MPRSEQANRQKPLPQTRWTASLTRLQDEIAAELHVLLPTRGNRAFDGEL